MSDVPIEVTGHSLGGGLAQMAAARNPDAVGHITTFQAPGVNQEDVDRINAENERRLANNEAPIDTDHFRIEDEIVPWAGEGHPPGTVHTLTVDHPDHDVVDPNHPAVQLAGLGGVALAEGVNAISDAGQTEVESHTSFPLTALALQTAEGRDMLPGIEAVETGVRVVGSQDVREANAERPLDIAGVNVAEIARDGIGNAVRTAERVALDTDRNVENTQVVVDRAADAGDRGVDGAQRGAGHVARVANAGIDQQQRQVNRNVAAADNAIDTGQRVLAPVLTPIDQAALDVGQNVVHHGVEAGHVAVDGVQHAANDLGNGASQVADGVQRRVRGTFDAGQHALDGVQRRAHEARAWMHD
jgi:hypothetical protein